MCCLRFGHPASALTRMEEPQIPAGACPKCRKTDALELCYYRAAFHDGEIWCQRCGVFVRRFDAG
jgi:hypothetical protein